MGSGGKSGQQTENYYGTMAGGICVGPVDELVAIIANGQEVWPKGNAWSVGLNCVPGTLYVFDAQSWTCTSSHTAATANAPGSGLEGWTEYTFKRGTNPYDDFTIIQSDGTHLGTLRFYWGTQAQTVDYYLQSANNDGGVKGDLGFGDQHPDYKGLCYIVLIDFNFGQDVSSGPNIEVVVRRKPNQTLITDAAAAITDGQCNLAAALVELLTDKNCLGLPLAMLDATSFQSVADWLYTYQNLYGASILIDSSQQLRSLLDGLMAMFDGYIRFNPATKLIELGVYQHGVTPAAYTTLTADALVKAPKFSTTSWQGTTSRAVVRYNSRQLNYQQTSEQVDDPRAFFVLGMMRDQSLDRPYIARQAQAWIHGRETLRVAGHAVTTGTLEVRREFGRGVRAGDYVLVDVDLEPGGSSVYQFFRVTKRTLPPTGPITLEVTADNTLATVPWNSTAPPIIISTAVVPPITVFRILEVPYALALEVGAVVVLAQRPSNLLIGNNVYIDTDPAGTFSLLGNAGNYAAVATLASDVAATDTTLHLTVDTSLVDASYFTNEYTANDATNDTMLAFLVDVSAGQVAESGGYAIMEICSVSVQTLIGTVSGVGGDDVVGVGGDNLAGVTGGSICRYDLTVLRGRKSTAATAFAAANTEVWLIPAALLNFLTANIFDQVRANRLLGLTPNVLQFRFCPFTFASSLDLASATSNPFQFPLNSASVPSLTLTTPASFNQALTPATLPAIMKVAGSWATQDNSLVRIQILARLATDTTDRVIVDNKFSATGKKSFATAIQFDEAGSWTVKLIASDWTGIVVERDIAVSVTTAAAIKCALPQMYDSSGNEIVDTSGQPRFVSGKNWNVFFGSLLNYGPLALACSTPGATIFFSTSGACLFNGNIASQTSQTYVQGAEQPFFMPGSNTGTGIKFLTITAWATAPGYAASDNVTFYLPLIFN